MPREQNFFLGRGERLASQIDVPRGGGPKNPPYPFAEAKQRISRTLGDAQVRIAALPVEACPNDEAVAVIQMHPRYISKSDFPSSLLDSVGLRAIGSRSAIIAPDKWGIKEHPERATTEEIFVAGPRAAWESWAQGVRSWRETVTGAGQLSRIEKVRTFEPTEKLKGLDFTRETPCLLEVVLHDSQHVSVVPSFLHYATRLGATPVLNRRRDIHGLSFIPVWATAYQAAELAKFSFVRVARGMPTLRPFSPMREVGGQRAILPAEAALDPSTRAVIFDGGLPLQVRPALGTWVRYIEPPGIGQATPDGEAHGLAVTGAFLFGPLQPGQPLPRPYCSVDHVRVTDRQTGHNDFEYLDALDRIVSHLEANENVYDLVNISMGPAFAIDDDDINQWTARLDEFFAHGKMLPTVAAGNDGHLDAALKLNRIQPPADGVNVLSVGASVAHDNAERAVYSCVGPGRSPGVVKPDAVAFGGTQGNEFGILAPDLSVRHSMGTSFASPLALRAAAAIMVQVGHTAVGVAADDTQLSPLAARALLIHRADAYEQQQTDVGWGLLECHPNRLITCEDYESMVVYQGQLPVGQHLRLPVPLSNEPLEGMVEMTATLLIAPQVDSSHPGNYTVSGVVPTFRPHCDKFTETRDEYGEVRRSAHPKSATFFSQNNLYSAPEYELREDGHKWEPCLRTTKRFRGSSLKQPCFELYYNHRDGLEAAEDPEPIPYAVVITTRVVKVPDFYNRVLRAWPQILIPVRPRVRIAIQG